MRLLFIGRSTDRTLMPVSVLVAFPFGFITMGYCANVTTGVTSGIAGIVIIMRVLRVRSTANGALVPVVGRIVRPRVLIVVSYGASIATGVTVRVTCVIVFVI